MKTKVKYQITCAACGEVRTVESDIVLTPDEKQRVEARRCDKCYLRFIARSESAW